MSKQLESAKKALRTQAVAEAQAVEDAKPKQVEDEIKPVNE